MEAVCWKLLKLSSQNQSIDKVQFVTFTFLQPFDPLFFSKSHTARKGDSLMSILKQQSGSHENS